MMSYGPSVTEQRLFMHFETRGFTDGRRPKGRATKPDYAALGMDRVAGPPTEKEMKMYAKVTNGGQMGKDGFVAQTLMVDTDLIADRYIILTFRALLDLYEKYLGRTNDINHSHDLNDAAGRLIDLAIGVDPSVDLHPDTPVSILKSVDPLNSYAGQYAALIGTMAFPNVGAGSNAIRDLQAGLIQDVSISFRPDKVICSECLNQMESFFGITYCSDHGLPGMMAENATSPMVGLISGVRDVGALGHVESGATARAKYVLDPHLSSADG